MRTKIHASVTALPILLTLTIASCDEGAAVIPGQGWIVTLSSAPAIDDGPDQLVATSPVGERVLLSEGFEEVHAPCLSHDGRRLAFAGRRAGDLETGLYEVDLESRELKELSASTGPVEGACFLSGAGLCYRSKGGESDILYTLDEEQPATRISFAPGRLRGPVLLQDGRLLYAVRSDRGEADRLLAVHVDGTGVTVYAELLGMEWRVRQVGANASGDLVVLAHGDEANDVLLFVDVDRPAERGVTQLSLDVPPIHGFDWMPSGELLLACDDGVYRATVEERSARHILTAPADRIVRAVLAVVERPRPSPHLSLVDASKTTAEVFCVDVRRSRMDRVRDSQADDVARVRLLGAAPDSEPIAEADVWPDGSFYATVPADVPVRVELLGRDGKLLAAGRHSFWMRPAERRGCVGCHEDRLGAAPNQMPLALKAPEDPR